MASNVLIDSTNFASLIGRYYIKKGLEGLYPELELYKLAKKVPLSKNGGNTVYFHKYTEYTKVGATVVGGVTPTQIDMSTSGVTVTLKQRANWIQIQDMVDMTAIESGVTAAAELFGKQAAFSIDKEILWRLTGASAGYSTESFDSASEFADTLTHLSDVLDGQQGGLSTLYISSNGTVMSSFKKLYAMLSGQSDTTGASAVQATVNEFQLDYMRVIGAVAKLRANNAKPYPDGLYAGVAHPYVLSRLMSDPDFITWVDGSTYAAEKKEKAFVGTFGGVKWMPSTNMQLTKSCLTLGSLSVAFSFALSLITGPEAFAVTEIEGEGGFEIITKRPNNTDTSNPVNLWSTVGWKTTIAAVVLDPKRAYLIGTFVTGVA